MPPFVPLEPTWRTRADGVRPRLYLDRPYQQGMCVSAPLPQEYQSGMHPELFALIPRRVGQFAQAAMLERFARALDLGYAPSTIEDSAGVDLGAPAPQATPLLAVANRAQHANYRLFVSDAVDEQLLPQNPLRTYLLVVNVATAAGARIAFDSGSNNGMTLAAAPASGQWGGKVELTTGSVSSVHAQGVGGTAELLIIEGTSYPRRLCELPGCVPVEVH